MSEIETLLKKHTDDVGKALEGFAGKVDTIQGLVTALNKRADDAEAKANRLTIGGGASEGHAPTEIKQMKIPDAERKAIGAIMKGNLDAPELKEMVTRRMSDGGFLVPEQTALQVEMLVRKQSPMRRVARVVDMPTGSMLYPLSRGAFEAGWVGEDEARPETGTASIALMQPSGGTVYALPSASEEVLDDCIVNLEQFITENVVDVIAEKESMAFTIGDGVKKPQGFIRYAGEKAPVATTDATRALGVLQYVPTGAAADLDNAKLIEQLVAMVFATKAGYRQAPGCAWLASTTFIQRLAGLKDAQGNPIYLPSLREDTPGVLLGFPVVEMEHMDGIAAGSIPIAFGNWQRGYVIGDRTTLNILRDPYTTKGRIKWYFRKRVYGEVLNSEAIKLLKVAAA